METSISLRSSVGIGSEVAGNEKDFVAVPEAVVAVLVFLVVVLVVVVGVMAEVAVYINNS